MKVGKFNKSKRETYKILCNVKLLYDSYLTKKYKKEFRSKLNNNPIIHVIKDEDFKYEKIVNFYTWKEYFIYKPKDKATKVILINKKDVLRIRKNIKASIINDTLLHKKYKLN